LSGFSPFFKQQHYHKNLNVSTAFYEHSAENLLAQR